MERIIVNLRIKVNKIGLGIWDDHPGIGGSGLSFLPNSYFELILKIGHFY